MVTAPTGRWATPHRLLGRMVCRLLPDSLFGRLALLLFVVVGASHVLVLSLMFQLHPPPPMPPPGAWPPPRPPGPMRVDMLLDLTVRLGAVLLAAWLGARWLAEPLRRLAQAAQAMAHDIGSPPLPETGTRECRQAAELINRLQAHVQVQLAQRDLFVAAVSHDLRTPLTRLALRAEALPQESARERFGRDIAEMDAMIRGTLDHLCGQADAEALRRLDLRALVQSLAEDAQDTGLPVSLDGGDAPQALLVLAQHTALRRCIANLVENAVRYGGQARIELRRAEADRVRVSVIDDGPGIPEALLPQVTLPFFRVDASRHRHHGGVGLGLAVADEVARRHGGSLHLANRPEGGLRADLELPLAP